MIEGLILHLYRHFYGGLEGFHREWTRYRETGGKEKWGGRKEKRGGRREKTGGEGEEGERREKRTPACPSHLHCIQTLYTRFGRSVLQKRCTITEGVEHGVRLSIFSSLFSFLPPLFSFLPPRFTFLPSLFPPLLLSPTPSLLSPGLPIHCPSSHNRRTDRKKKTIYKYIPQLRS